MTSLSMNTVKHIAKLANLIIDDDQIKKLQKQFEETLKFVDQLKEIDVTDITPTSQVTGSFNVLREDETAADRMFSQAQALSNASKTYNGFFVVPKILE